MVFRFGRSAVARDPGEAEETGRGPDLADVAGKQWNAPNTLLGLLYGGAGHVVGTLTGGDPRIVRGRNAIEFVKNPLGGVGALSLGNVVTWRGDPYDPTDERWFVDGRPRLENGHTYPEHEHRHTIQGQHLGPLYLPSHLLGGVLALLRQGRWHGESNWNERGPQANPPRPWTGRSER